MAIVARAPKRRAQPASVLQTLTLRDFSGLWNAADNDLNLPAKYAAQMVNMDRASDGSIAVRYGYKKFKSISGSRFIKGVSLTLRPQTTAATVSLPKHGLPNGSKIRFTDVPSGTHLGLTATDLGQSTVVYDPITVDKFNVVLTRTASPGVEKTITVTIEVFGPDGNIIDLDYLFDKLVFATDTGVIGTIDADGTVMVLWNRAIVDYQTFTSFETGVRVYAVAGSSDVEVALTVTPVRKVGDLLGLFKYPSIGGIPAAELNTEHIISSVSSTNGRYRIRLATKATSSTSDASGECYYSNSTAWSVCTFVSHTVFNRQAIFTNGVDKPVVMDLEYDPATEYPVRFLNDPATKSNLNTPIAKYVAGGNNYTVFAGNALEPGMLYISAYATNNTYKGDPAPNDAVNLDVGLVAPTTSSVITGIVHHKGFLFVTFDSCVVIVQLGTYEQDLHVPQVVDVITNFGCVAHKSILSVGEAFLACDGVGVTNVAESTLGERFRPVRVSELIAPHIAAKLQKLVPLVQNEKIWSVLDRRMSRYLLFIPYGSSEYITYVYSSLPERKITGWSQWRDMNFTIGCRTEADRIFVARGKDVFQLGNDSDAYYSDDGANIRFIWEMPWIDLDKRMASKKTRYVTFDTDGDSTFQLQSFVDRSYENLKIIREAGDVDYDEFTLPLTPEITKFFGAVQRAGYGGGKNSYYGGDRRVARAQLLSWTVQGKMIKFRITGSQNRKLRFTAMSVLYQAGSIRH